MTEVWCVWLWNWTGGVRRSEVKTPDFSKEEDRKNPRDSSSVFNCSCSHSTVRCLNEYFSYFSRGCVCMDLCTCVDGCACVWVCSGVDVVDINNNQIKWVAGTVTRMWETLCLCSLARTKFASGLGYYMLVCWVWLLQSPKLLLVFTFSFVLANLARDWLDRVMIAFSF